MDVEKVIESGDINELGELASLYNKRRTFEQLRRQTGEKRTPNAIFLRGVADAGLARMENEGTVTALQMLRAERRILIVTDDVRWTTMLEAREQGASWQDIAAAWRDMHGNSAGYFARMWYEKQITEIASELSEDDLARAHAALGNDSETVLGDDRDGDPTEDTATAQPPVEQPAENAPAAGTDDGAPAGSTSADE